jgi:predicted RND superfamily exporter protein
MKSIGFGLERIAWLALEWPRLAAVAFLLVLVLAGLGATRLSFDENLRNIFASKSEAFLAYKNTTSEFVDPENETLVLVEAPDLASPAVFRHLQDFQFELQLIDGVGSAYSMFSLREPPDASGAAALVIDDTAAGLTPALAKRIRAHPILGDKLLSADGKATLYVVTPTEPKAPLSVTRALKAKIEATAADLFAGTDVHVTVSGFPVIRAGILEVLKRDQIVLNVAGSIVGLIMALIVFRSLTAAVLAAIPAITGGLTVLGFMGLLGAKVTVMSTVIPALIMILGYADGMHLCFAWRRHRDTGMSVAAAERLAQREVGGACVLAAVTTAVAFLSLVISQVTLVRGFSIAGAIGIVGGTLVVLVAHALLTLAIGRFWKHRPGATPTFLAWLADPCGRVGAFVVGHARPISLASIVLLFVLGAMHYSVPPQHSVREHLPRDNPANAALGRIDREFGGVFPVQIVVPLDGLSPTSPAALARIGAVHRAVAGVAGVSTPLSLWSLAEWLGGGDADAGAARIAGLFGDLSPETRSRFVSAEGSALVTVSVHELPTSETEALANAIEKAAKAAGGGNVEVTGFTVVNSREGARTISNLNLSLSLSVVANLVVIAFAFRSIAVGIVSFLPNFLPILATGAFLFITGSGMQFTSVIALTVAFGIAVDGSVHFLNRFLLTGHGTARLSERLIETSKRIGPVLAGTTLIIVAGLSTTLTSGLPTISLFGRIAALTLAVALIGDLVVLPALMAGLARRWFQRRSAIKQQPEEVPA